MTSTQTPARHRVILTNWSPAREPNGLDPPAPPNAPASPPPLPRWISTISISNRPRHDDDEVQQRATSHHVGEQGHGAILRATAATGRSPCRLNC